MASTLLPLLFGTRLVDTFKLPEILGQLANDALGELTEATFERWQSIRNVEVEKTLAGPSADVAHHRSTLGDLEDKHYWNRGSDDDDEEEQVSLRLEEAEQALARATNTAFDKQQDGIHQRSMFYSGVCLQIGGSGLKIGGSVPRFLNYNMELERKARELQLLRNRVRRAVRPNFISICGCSEGVSDVGAKA